MQSVRYINQGDLDASLGYKLQKTFGFMEAAVFSLEGLGATVFGCFMFVESIGGMLAGLLLTLAGIALLFAHLGHPRKAWRALSCLRTSWISRGTAFVLTFMVCAGLTFLLAALGLRLPGAFAWALRALVLVSALLVLVYPGFVLAYSPSIPFWNSGLLPAVFALSGVTSGLAVCIGYLAVAPEPASAVGLPILLWVQIALLAVLLASLLAYVVVMHSAGRAAEESVRFLLSTAGRGEFLFVGCVLGILTPICLTLGAMGSSGMASLTVLAGIGKIAGDIFLRGVMIKAGIYDPVY